MPTIQDLALDIIEDCRTLINDQDIQFAPIIQYLNIGIEGEKIRWISSTPDDGYDDVERVARMKWGKVTKSNALYNHDTGHLYEVRINERIYNAMLQGEKKAFLFYLISHISITIDKKGDLRFGTLQDYATERIVKLVMKDYQLPSASTLVERGSI